MTRGGLEFMPALLCSVVAAALLAVVVSRPALRLRGDYFVLATLGFQIIFFSLLQNWAEVTQGTNGIAGVPVASVLGFELSTNQRYLAATVLIAAGTIGTTWCLAHSPFGRLLQACRDDEFAAASLGKNVGLIRTTAFVLASALAAVPGVLFAGYFRYVDPSSFTLSESIFIVCIVVVGGAGSFWGPVVGALLLVTLPESLRFLQLPEAVAASIRQIAYGGLLVILMRLRPQGIFGGYQFS
jgi:branched-chain amino acid transport system permease protein